MNFIAFGARDRRAFENIANTIFRREQLIPNAFQLFKRVAGKSINHRLEKWLMGIFVQVSEEHTHCMLVRELCLAVTALHESAERLCHMVAMRNTNLKSPGLKSILRNYVLVISAFTSFSRSSPSLAILASSSEEEDSIPSNASSSRDSSAEYTARQNSSTMPAF